jgi:tetratricopeptide (TPR) repeat protein
LTPHEQSGDLRTMDKDDDKSSGAADPNAGFAAGLALGAGGEKLDPRAAAYLKELTELARLQAEDLRREDAVRHWSLRVRHVSDVMKLAFELAIGLILVGLVAVIISAIWTASHDNGLVIEAFSVPPDMAARGLTGQVVAAQLQDKLVAMQNATDSARPAESYSANWGNDIKVEIPNTGVSISEAYRYLAGWLGSATRIGGEVFRTKDGIAVTARAGANGSATFSGAESDLDKLLQQLADKIYERTQPYRYAIYQQELGADHLAQARTVLERLAAKGTQRDRAWAYLGLGVLDSNQNAVAKANHEYEMAIGLEPTLVLALVNLEQNNSTFGHDEISLQVAKRAVALFDSGADIDMNDTARVQSALGEKINVATALADYGAARSIAQEAMNLPDYSNAIEIAHMTMLQTSAELHDKGGYERTVADLPPTSQPNQLVSRRANEALSRYWLGDWKAVVDGQAPFENYLTTTFNKQGIAPGFTENIFSRQERPFIAVARAKLGDFKGAHALIDKTPLDCTACLFGRGLVAAAEKDWKATDYWFARAVSYGPSLPFGYEEWGRALLDKGNASGAIAKFSAAHDKGPNYADPLEGWGEALMLQNRSDLALEKFAQAATHAPNWGRLHLKWGEALKWAGDPAGAKAQFATASSLYLLPEERAELARVSR